MRRKNWLQRKRFYKELDEKDQEDKRKMRQKGPTEEGMQKAGEQDRKSRTAGPSEEFKMFTALLLEKETQEAEQKAAEDTGKMADTHMIVATLIATISFAAGFTIPGGYHGDQDPNQGMAVLVREAAFKAFVITNTIAVVCSTSSVFLYVSASLFDIRGQERESRARRYAFAFGLTITAMLAMMLAFITVVPNLVDFNFMILGNGKFEIGFLGCPNSSAQEYSHSKFDKLPLLGCYAHQLFDEIPKNCWLFHLRAFFYPLGDVFSSPPSFYAFWILGARNGGQRTFLPWQEGVGEEKPVDLMVVGVRHVHSFGLEERVGVIEEFAKIDMLLKGEKEEKEKSSDLFTSDTVPSERKLYTAEQAKSFTMDPSLYTAAMEGKLEDLKQYTDRFALQFTKNNNTVLHVVAEFGHSHCVADILSACPLLLRRENTHGDTPLHIAAAGGHDDVVESLINFAKPPADNQNNEIDAANNSGGEGGVAPAVREMLKARNHDGDTPLHLAARYRDPRRVVSLLTAADERLDYRPNKAGETPLYLVVHRGSDAAVVSEMLKNCKSPAYGGPGGRTAMHAAVIESSKDAILDKLLDWKQDLIKERDTNGWTSLHFAAQNGNFEAVKKLLDKDKSVAYASNDEGNTALHIATATGDVLVMNEILQKFPDCWEMANRKGRTILHIAVDVERDVATNFILKKPWIAGNGGSLDKTSGYMQTRRKDGHDVLKTTVPDAVSEHQSV
ncbi:hypothetical protein RHMOL_Rhmol04G0313200 [Rhododendron molle]|uniref:Uncharacterized protein n=1 Tax=Rhododendron molle TaxID=49168 RepID=A0ACC0P8Q6_RHOML|nr:hypothetical protein RHMOL_Rhmol04G0313200 [Rhododendron molle]